MEPAHVRRIVQTLSVLLAQRQNRPACAGNPDALVQLLDRSFDIVVRLEHRVGVEDELDIGVELTGLTLDRRRLANRLSAPDGDEIEVVKLAEGFGELDRPVGAAIVDEDDLAWAQRLSQHRRQTQHDVVFLVEGRNDHVDLRRPPVFGGRRGCLDRDHA